MLTARVFAVANFPGQVVLVVFLIQVEVVTSPVDYSACIHQGVTSVPTDFFFDSFSNNGQFGHLRVIYHFMIVFVLQKVSKHFQQKALINVSQTLPQIALI